MKYCAELTGITDLLEIHSREPERFPFLLQSVAHHARSGRFDILFAFPGERVDARGGLDALDRAFDEAGSVPSDPRLPFVGGWFLLLGYEAAGLIEPGLRLPPAPFRFPEILAVRCRGALVVDRERGLTYALSELGPESLNDLKKVVENSVSKEDIGNHDATDVTEDPPENFLLGVARIHDYLRAGDVFQVNLSRRWRARMPAGCRPHHLYRRLRQHNPAPFAGLAVVGDTAVISSSPERLVAVEGREVQTRPIAGTRPRRPGDDDPAVQAQLLGSLKERAEHVMLIDLERNDLGRLCVPGSVEVSELMTLERYAHVHHIVSNVRGRLREGVGPGSVLRAVFPGGTITGCPKVRAMQIIAELERVGRGPYTGAMGYLSRCGRMDTSILIRTLVMHGQDVSFRAGAGIVVDSEPLAELAETRAKARGLLLALGAAP